MFHNNKQARLCGAHQNTVRLLWFVGFFNVFVLCTVKCTVYYIHKPDIRQEMQPTVQSLSWGLPVFKVSVIYTSIYEGELCRAIKQEMAKLFSFNTTFLQMIVIIFWPQVRINRNLTAPNDKEEQTNKQTHTHTKEVLVVQLHSLKRTYMLRISENKTNIGRPDEELLKPLCAAYSIAKPRHK